MKNEESRRLAANKSLERIETTIGELVEAITEIALESGSSEQECYHLASVTIESILRKSRRGAAVIN